MYLVLRHVTQSGLKRWDYIDVQYIYAVSQREQNNLKNAKYTDCTGFQPIQKILKVTFEIRHHTQIWKHNCILGIAIWEEKKPLHGVMCMCQWFYFSKRKRMNASCFTVSHKHYLTQVLGLRPAVWFMLKQQLCRAGKMPRLKTCSTSLPRLARNHSKKAILQSLKSKVKDKIWTNSH